MIIFVSFLGANFDQKYKQKFCIFALFWHIFGKIQLVPNEKLVEFVTLDIPSYTYQIKQIDLYKNVLNSYLNAFKHIKISQIVPNSMMLLE